MTTDTIAPTDLARALAAVEKAERLMEAADRLLANVRATDQESQRSLIEARHILDEAGERMTTTTCSLIKDQALSDRVSTLAREDVAKIKRDAANLALNARLS